MSYRALTDVLLGQSPPAKPGDILPDTFQNMEGQDVPVDFERLVELGAAEKVASKPAPPKPSPEKAKQPAKRPRAQKADS